MRYSSKVDANQSKIVDALRAIGCGVHSTSGMRKGFPDLIVSFLETRRVTVLMEVKDGKKPPSARELNPQQEEFHRFWPGEIYVVKNIDEALAIVGKKRG